MLVRDTRCWCWTLPVTMRFCQVPTAPHAVSTPRAYTVRPSATATAASPHLSPRPGLQPGVSVRERNPLPAKKGHLVQRVTAL